MGRERLRRCPTCLRGGFTVERTIPGETGDGRPMFTCTACKAMWTSGRDGLPYLPFAMNKLEVIRP